MHLGTDIIEIQRIRMSIRRHPAFKERILTPGEREKAKACKDPASFVAGRFAAKEAVVKCLGIGLRGFSWQDMEILGDEFGKPRLNMSSKLAAIARQCGVGRIEVSISHSRDYALAVAIGEEFEDEDCNRRTNEQN